MRKSITLFFAAGFLSLPAQAKTPDQGALFSLTRFVDNQEHKLAAGEELSAGTTLQLHAAGIHQPCLVFVLPFQRGKSRAIATMVPDCLRLLPDEENAVTFHLKEPVKAGELFVVVVPTQSSPAEDMTRLLVDWKSKPKDSQGPRSALHDRLSEWLARRDKKLTYAGPPPKELGGVRTTSAQAENAPAPALEARPSEAGKPKATTRALDMPAYPWKKQANWVPCSATEPGVFVYPLGK